MGGKNMITCTIDGNFNDKACEKIKQVMQGKTYFNFDIHHGGYGTENQTLIIQSDNDDHTAEELKSMFIFVALNELAKRA